MDLGAYIQINDLDKLAQKNGIICPRLRGYRLMKNELEQDYREIIKDNNMAYECAVNLCHASPFWNLRSCCHSYDPYTDWLEKYYTNEETRSIKWERIHGWKRRVLKTEIHNACQRYKRQFEVWNKYVGQENILYIHARIGGNNWPMYYKEVVNQPWFIEKVDDAWDSTYCDIYAQLTKTEDV